MVEEAPQRGGSGLEGGSPGMTCPQHHRTRWGQMRGHGGRWWRKPVGASGIHWLLSACAPLCVPGVAPVVVVPVVWRPLALVLIVLVPLLSILLILVVAGLRVGLCSRGWWWGVRGWGVAAVAPIVVGRWWWRWRWWGCIGLAVTALVVRWLVVTRLWRAVAANSGGAGTDARARDVAVLAIAADPWWIPSWAVAGWWRGLLWWRLRWWWLLRGWLLLGSSIVAASVIGVVVIPAIVTPAVLVVATTSTAVETSSVVAASTTASSSVLEASSVSPRGASVVIALESATTPSAPEATTASIVKALFRGWPGFTAFLVVLSHQLVCFFSLQLNEQDLIQEVPNIWQREVGFHFQDSMIWDILPFFVGSFYCSVF